MNNPQYINNVTINGAPENTQPSDLNPDQPGVDFTSPNASIIVSFPSDVTPIIVNVSVPNTNTNVVEIIVVITAPNGTVLFNQTSPPGTNSVTGFPVEPLPEGSVLTVIPVTADGSAPENVTLSVIACYTPSTATTMVSTGSTPPTVSSSTATISVSFTTTEIVTGIAQIQMTINTHYFIPNFRRNSNHCYRRNNSSTNCHNTNHRYVLNQRVIFLYYSIT